MDMPNAGFKAETIHGLFNDLDCIFQGLKLSASNTNLVVRLTATVFKITDVPTNKVTKVYQTAISKENAIKINTRTAQPLIRHP